YCTQECLYSTGAFASRGLHCVGQRRQPALVQPERGSGVPQRSEVANCNIHVLCIALSLGNGRVTAIDVGREVVDSLRDRRFRDRRTVGRSCIGRDGLEVERESQNCCPDPAENSLQQPWGYEALSGQEMP